MSHANEIHRYMPILKEKTENHPTELPSSRSGHKEKHKKTISWAPQFHKEGSSPIKTLKKTLSLLLFATTPERRFAPLPCWWSRLGFTVGLLSGGVASVSGGTLTMFVESILPQIR